MKVLCIVQARMGSERLPGKVMKNILGKPMITYVLERLNRSKYIDQIVVATTDQDSDKPLVNYLQDMNYNIYCGDENNVLKRYNDVANIYSGDIIIRITGDCPLIDPIIVDQVITNFLINEFDYIRLDVPNTYIRGFDVEIFTKEALEKVYNIASKVKDYTPYKEHVTLYMYKHPKEFQIGKIEGISLYQKDYRLCVDTIEDFELVKRIYEYFQNVHVSSKDVVKFIDAHPELVEINQNIEQKNN